MRLKSLTTQLPLGKEQNHFFFLKTRQIKIYCWKRTKELNSSPDRLEKKKTWFPCILEYDFYVKSHVTLRHSLEQKGRQHTAKDATVPIQSPGPDRPLYWKELKTKPKTIRIWLQRHH